MIVERLSSVSEFHDLVLKYPAEAIFRGVSQERFNLVPRIGRSPLPSLSEKDKSRIVIARETRLLDQFKLGAIPHLRRLPRNNWEWLVTAQHFGLPTRLLDWTENALVALYFAAEADPRSDGAVYVHTTALIADMQRFPDPFKVTLNAKFRPPHLHARVIAQAGVFTVQPDPKIPFEAKEILKLIVPKKMKPEALNILTKYGIHPGTLFPGLDGLARQICAEMGDWAIPRVVKLS